MNEVVSHVPLLLQRARRFCRNDADACDLVQDTCVHALEALRDREIVPDNLAAWLVVVLRNQWFSTSRRQRVRTHAQVELAARAGVDDSMCETGVLGSQLKRAWSQLSSQSQTIARQCLLEGDSQEAVSRRLGMTAGGVAASIHRTRAALWTSMFGSND
jgi:RNA polymerase sigma-70 factor (ECF subfamily)